MSYWFKTLLMLRISGAILTTLAFVSAGCGDDEAPRRVQAQPTQQAAPAQNATVAAQATRSSPGSKTTGISKVGQLEATKIGVGKIIQTDHLDTSEFSSYSVFIPSKTRRKVKSADGSMLAWREKIDGSYNLVISKSNGNGKQVLKGGRNGYQPSWSPNAKNIAFTAINWETGKRSLYKYNLKSQRKVSMWSAEQGVGAVTAWSPDGTKILFTYFNNLWIMNTAGIGKRMLPLNMKVGEADILGFSNDGSRIVYKARAGGNYHLIDLKPEL